MPSTSRSINSSQSPPSKKQKCDSEPTPTHQNVQNGCSDSNSNNNQGLNPNNNNNNNSEEEVLNPNVCNINDENGNISHYSEESIDEFHPHPPAESGLSSPPSTESGEGSLNSDIIRQVQEESLKEYWQSLRESNGASVENPERKMEESVDINIPDNIPNNNIPDKSSNKTNGGDSPKEFDYSSGDSIEERIVRMQREETDRKLMKMFPEIAQEREMAKRQLKREKQQLLEKDIPELTQERMRLKKELRIQKRRQGYPVDSESTDSLDTLSNDEIIDTSDESQNELINKKPRLDVHVESEDYDGDTSDSFFSHDESVDMSFYPSPEIDIPDGTDRPSDDSREGQMLNLILLCILLKSSKDHPKDQMTNAHRVPNRLAY